MKLYSGKRIGQSGQELATAVTFSLFLHVVFFLAAVLLFFTVKPRFSVPPVYSVKLVSQPGEPSVQAPPPVEQKQPEKQTVPLKAKEKKSAAKQRPARNNALPDLGPSKPKTAAPVQDRTVEPEAPAPQKASPAQEYVAGVGTLTPTQDFKFGWYLDLVRSRIGQHWNPPPDASEAKARVVFSINRSGWVGDVTLDAEQSLGSFGFKQAAVRAIRASNPFPRLPEEFSRQTLEFTVDLMAVD